MDKPGADIRAEDENARKEAARLMGSVTSERKKKTSAENAKKSAQARTGRPLSEEHRAAQRAAQQARRRAERIAQGLPPEPEEKPKRPRGRPKKEVVDNGGS
jgi:hypothetical protein